MEKFVAFTTPMKDRHKPDGEINSGEELVEIGGYMPMRDFVRMTLAAT